VGGRVAGKRSAGKSGAGRRSLARLRVVVIGAGFGGLTAAVRLAKVEAGVVDGLPNLQDLDKLLIGRNVRETLECDLRLEQSALSALHDGIANCKRARFRHARLVPARSSRPRRITSTSSRRSST